MDKPQLRYVICGMLLKIYIRFCQSIPKKSRHDKDAAVAPTISLASCFERIQEACCQHEHVPFGVENMSILQMLWTNPHECLWMLDRPWMCFLLQFCTLWLLEPRKLSVFPFSFSFSSALASHLWAPEPFVSWTLL